MFMGCGNPEIWLGYLGTHVCGLQGQEVGQLVHEEIRVDLVLLAQQGLLGGDTCRGHAGSFRAVTGRREAGEKNDEGGGREGRRTTMSNGNCHEKTWTSGRAGEDSGLHGCLKRVAEVRSSPDRTSVVVKPPSLPKRMSVSRRSPTMQIWSRRRPNFSAMLASMNSAGLPTTMGSFFVDPGRQGGRRSQ